MKQTKKIMVTLLCICIAVCGLCSSVNAKTVQNKVRTKYTKTKYKDGSYTRWKTRYTARTSGSSSITIYNKKGNTYSKKKKYISSTLIDGKITIDGKSKTTEEVSVTTYSEKSGSSKSKKKITTNKTVYYKGENKGKTTYTITTETWYKDGTTSATTKTKSLNGTEKTYGQ